MCGIAGAVGADAREFTPAVQRMCDHMAPRGPDGGRVAACPGSDNFDALLGARRLAIIDPSSAGDQPFVDRQRGNVVVYNGMIYNYRELRRELEGAGESFESACDTEVLLRAYGRYGVDCLSHLQGMFAFAVWDAATQQLLLARDRIGIKPLYYSVLSGRLLFASQLKTLVASGLIPPDLSPEGIESFLSFGAVHEPATILEHVEALPPAHYALWSRDGFRLHAHWEPPEATTTPNTRGDPTPAELEQQLDLAVDRHLLSDAPAGVFLSGGLDSSVVAGLADRHAPRLKTVSVRFEESRFSEAPYQRLVAERLGSDHAEVQLTAGELLQDLPSIFEAMDQPTVDGINTYTVSRAARDVGLKVALSGLGADELFDGYGTVRRMKLLEASRRLPGPLQKAAAIAAGAALSHSKGKKAKAWLSGELPANASYELLRRRFLPNEVRRLSQSAAPRPAPYASRTFTDQPIRHWVSVAELAYNIRNTVLPDTDSMSMAHGLEVRVPFLDDNVVDWSLTHAANGATLTKRFLGEAAAAVLPQAVLTRRKHPFEVPISSWLHGPLRGEVTDVLLSDIPRGLEGHLRVDAVEDVWNGFLAGREHWMHPWALYALSSWVRSCEGLVEAAMAVPECTGQARRGARPVRRGA
jgi:asparagine synthase (glutamine-hydrolysing)